MPIKSYYDNRTPTVTGMVPERFTELTDTFSNYVGKGGQTLSIKPTEDGLETINVANTVIPSLGEITNDPTGFRNRDDSVISFDDATRTFTISPKVDSYSFCVKGISYVYSGSSSVTIDDIEGTHFFYFDENGDLQTTTEYNTSIIIENTFVSYLYWDATNKEAMGSFLAEERHGVSMSGVTHAHLHQTLGTVYRYGLALQNIVLGDGTLDTDMQFSVENGRIADEDIELDIVNGEHGTLFPIAEIPILYKIEMGKWRSSIPTQFPVINIGTGRLAYNKETDGVWSLEEVPNGDYVLVHYYAVNGLENRIIGILGENYYDTINEARQGATTEINYIDLLGLFVIEYVPIASVIYQTSDVYTNQSKARIVSVDGGSSYIDFRGEYKSHSLLIGLNNPDHPATAITYDNTTSLLESNLVQGGMDELTEYLAYDSAGFITDNGYIDNGDGTITFPNNTVLLYDNPNYKGRLYKFDVIGGTTGIDLAEIEQVTAGTTNYIYVDFNDGQPIYKISTNIDVINESNTIPYLTVCRYGNELSIISWDKLGAGLNNKLNMRFIKTRRFELEEGLIITTNPDTTINLSAGKIWYGGKRSDLVAVNSNTDSFSLWYHDNGVWTKDETVTTFNNTQYDNGANLVTLNPNKITINWVYRVACEQNHFGVILGNIAYGDLNEAMYAIPPTDLPDSIKTQAILCGRIIVETNNATPLKIDSAELVHFKALDLIRP